jgi:hypothetical protein
MSTSMDSDMQQAFFPETDNAAPALHSETLFAGAS